jgi:uncharacterized membrane protein
MHPYVVHFPIALFVTAVALDVVCLVRRQATWLDRAAVNLHVLSVLGAGVAIWTGNLAAGDVSTVGPEVEALIGEHSDWAFFTLIGFVGVVLLRFESFWRDRAEPEISLRKIRLVAFIVEIGVVWLLVETARRGGALVYQYGVGVM